MGAGLLDGDPHPLDRQRVLGADVDVTLPRADGVRRDQHAFDHRMRIRFEETPVHVGARIAFVAIPDEVLRDPRLRPARPPFRSCGEPAASTPTQPRPRDLVENLVARHGRECLLQRRISVPSQVVLDPLGVDDTLISQDDQLLLAEEGDISKSGDGSPGVGRRVHQRLHGLAVQKVLLDQARDIVWLQPAIEGGIGCNDHQRSLAAEPIAASAHDGDAVAQPLARDLLFEAFLQLKGTAGDAPCAGA